WLLTVAAWLPRQRLGSVSPSGLRAKSAAGGRDDRRSRAWVWYLGGMTRNTAATPRSAPTRPMPTARSQRRRRACTRPPSVRVAGQGQGFGAVRGKHERVLQARCRLPGGAPGRRYGALSATMRTYVKAGAPRQKVRGNGRDGSSYCNTSPKNFISPQSRSKAR